MAFPPFLRRLFAGAGVLADSMFYMIVLLKHLCYDKNPPVMISPPGSCKQCIIKPNVVGGLTWML
jgi:hypothetical protein